MSESDASAAGARVRLPPSAVPGEFVRGSHARTVLTLVFDWALIAAAVFASEWTRSTWIYGLCLIVIARQMNALYELHHHAIHGNLFRSRRWNERMDWLYSIPLFIRVAEEREEHMEHHRTYGIEDKDYLEWGSGYGLDPSRRTSLSYMLWFLLVRPFVGVLQVYALIEVVNNPGWMQPGFRRALAFFWATVLSALLWAGRLEWAFWYWLVPFFTVQPVLFFWDDMIGHYNCPRTGTRDMRGPWFRMMAAHGAAYHNVHHRCAKIPWYKQARASALLEDEGAMDVARGFVDAIRQMAVACE